MEQVGGDIRCAFYEVDPTGKHLTHIVGMPLSYAECVDGFKVGPDSLACGLAVFTKKPVISPDVDTDPLWEHWRWVAKKYDFQAVWSFPIETFAGKVVGTFAVYSRAPRQPTPRNLEGAAVITRAAAMIMSRHEAVHRGGLVQRDLDESEIRLRQLLEVDDLAIVMLDTKGTINGWNHGAEVITGFGRDEAVGSYADLFFTPEDKRSGAATDEIATASEKGSAIDERWHQRKNGSRFWGSGVLAATRDPLGNLLGFIKVLRNETAQRGRGSATVGQGCRRTGESDEGRISGHPESRTADASLGDPDLRKDPERTGRHPS